MNLKRILVVPLLLIVAGVSLAACGSDSSPETGKVEVENAWARTTPPGQTTGAIYAELKAGDSADKLLSAAVPADVAGKVEIHESMPAEADMPDAGSSDESTSGSHDKSGDMSEGESHEGGGDEAHPAGEQKNHKASQGQDHMSAGDHGNMKMKQVHSVDVPAGETVLLEPGGLHIMLFDLAKPLQAGQIIPVTLSFEQAGEIKVDATVRDE